MRTLHLRGLASLHFSGDRDPTQVTRSPLKWRPRATGTESINTNSTVEEWRNLGKMKLNESVRQKLELEVVFLIVLLLRHSNKTWVLW